MDIKASKAPVVVFVYNRADKAQSCLKALETNKECAQTDLHIFADGAKTEEDRIKVDEVRNYIKEYMAKSKFAHVYFVESPYNKGLADSIIGGATEVIKQYGRAIMIEDDLIVSEDFLEYMNSGLDYYADCPNVGSITGYTLPLKTLKRYKKDVYLLRKGESLGWATWEDRWRDVDWEVSDFNEYKMNKVMRKEFAAIGYGLDSMLCNYMEGSLDVWAVRWCYHLYKKKMLTVYPRVSRVDIILDETATHCDAPTDKYSHKHIGSDTKPVFEVLKADVRLEKLSYRYERGIVLLINEIEEHIKKALGMDVNRSIICK